MRQKILKHRWFLVLLSVLVLLRLSLIGRGACALGDEYRYWFSAHVLLEGSAGHLRAALAPLFETGGRPGLALIQLPALTIQAVLYKLVGLDIRSPESLIIPQLVQVLATLWGLLLVYRIGHSLGSFSSTTVLFIVALCGLSVSSILYIRHLLPYIYGFTLFLCCIWMVLANKRPVYIGLLTAFAYSVYPGYWAFCVVVGVALLVHRRSVKDMAVFAGGFLGVLVLYQILSWCTGRSFYADSVFAANDFLYGPQYKYDGGFGLLADYLWTVEGVLGGLILAALVLNMVHAAGRIFQQKMPTLVQTICAVFLMMALLQFVSGYISDRKVFYGRLFFPLVTLGIFSVAEVAQYWLPNTRWRHLFYSTILLVVGWHFTRSYRAYQQLGYPRDLLFDMGYTTAHTDGEAYDINVAPPHNDGLVRVFEIKCTGFPTQPPAGWLLQRPRLAAPDSTLVFLNFAEMSFPFNAPLQTYYPPVDSKWLVQRRHFESFVPYWFEFSIPEFRAGFARQPDLWLGILLI